ncbi:1,6-anhydro-N-acetylmuramyl-L-alanine amidase AmpD [Dongshaea marina]|uniref:1,6-anhydro-N-acetylmuramyl-L-alanine amidase AmpD n=1 Tax=Dongshaea marina TaxID=2047966 RepID=UPI000D3EB14E|nr:1,6-anhydro-N-acetylmuramyl-L-alanine amidase AmpD [Dongshaea marina]
MDSFDEAGWLKEARSCPSPHFDARPDAMDVSLVVLHCISLPPGRYGGKAIDQFFQGKLDPRDDLYFEEIAPMRVSAHFLIRRDGELVQYVSVDHRAWHAGVSSFEGRERCNDFSVGIELEGTDSGSYQEEQYQCLTRLLTLLMARYPAITAQRITRHSDIAPGRKTDPGPGFAMTKLQELLGNLE